MSNTLLNLSTKIDPEINYILTEVLSSSKQFEIEFFVIGATARDLIIKILYDKSPVRATKDIDFGVRVDDWDHFNKLRDDLLNKIDFKSTSTLQTIIYKHTNIDIVPFGRIEKDSKIGWPPNNDTVMNVEGFDIAYANSLSVKLNDTDVAQFISLQCLALLKVFAWEDRKFNTNKDADDFSYLLVNYTNFDNLDRMVKDFPEYLVSVDHDYELAGARLLGHDIKHILDEKTLQSLLGIINNETGEQDRYLLAEQMSRVSRKNTNNVDWHLKILEQFKQGLLD